MSLVMRVCGKCHCLDETKCHTSQGLAFWAKKKKKKTVGYYLTVAFTILIYVMIRSIFEEAWSNNTTKLWLFMNALVALAMLPQNRYFCFERTSTYEPIELKHTWLLNTKNDSETKLEMSMSSLNQCCQGIIAKKITLYKFNSSALTIESLHFWTDFKTWWQFGKYLLPMTYPCQNKGSKSVAL